MDSSASVPIPAAAATTTTPFSSPLFADGEAAVDLTTGVSGSSGRGSAIHQASQERESQDQTKEEGGPELFGEHCSWPQSIAECDCLCCTPRHKQVSKQDDQKSEQQDEQQSQQQQDEQPPQFSQHV